MKQTVLDVIVVGAGFAGLSASYHLKKYGLNHIVFDRGKIGQSWRSQRWDSFRLNSTNKLNVLPGMAHDPATADKFASAPEFISSLEKYVSLHQLPVSQNSTVIAIEKEGELFRVSVMKNGSVSDHFSRQVIIASGSANEIKIPSFAANIRNNVKQLHAGQYRNPDQLPAGAILVVGGAQSGIQIAEDLVDAGKKVYFSTSMVGRFPRWYRGKDIFYWIIDTKFYEIKAHEVEDPKTFKMPPPQVSGTGTGKQSVSLQSLSKKGVVILGKASGANGSILHFEPNAATHVKFADEFSGKIKKMIDDFITVNNIDAPAPHHDEADIPDVNATCTTSITSLDLDEHNVTTVIWATGFTTDLSYIRLPAFDNDGKLKQKEGIPDIPGLYFLGYPWLRSRKSAILFGIIHDVEFIVDRVYKCSDINSRSETTIV